MACYIFRYDIKCMPNLFTTHSSPDGFLRWSLLASDGHTVKEWKERKKADLRGDRTHTSCYPGSCSKPVKLEGAIEC